MATKRSTNSASVNAEQKRRDIEKYHEQIFYSARYSDDCWEYRHVILPKQLVKYLPTDRLALEEEWRGLGIRQSPGWEHYMRHAPEPHVLLFKREKDYQTKYVDHTIPCVNLQITLSKLDTHAAIITD